MSPEQEFEQRLDVHRRDSKSCAIFLYTLLTTHTLAGSDFGLFDRVNAHAGFWNGTLAGLQAAAYIALGRIYDPNDSNYNALALLAYTKEHFGIFSRSALQARKIRVGMSPDDAMRYVSQAFEEYEPKRTDLAPLQSALNEQREVYVTKVQPIRHEVFAHSGRLTPKIATGSLRNHSIGNLSASSCSRFNSTMRCFSFVTTVPAHSFAMRQATSWRCCAIPCPLTRAHGSNDTS